MAEIYRIPAVNFLRLKEEIGKLNKRAKRLNLPPVELTVTDTVVEVHTDDILGIEHHETIYLCKVEGESPKLAGWSLIAIIKPAGTENLVNEVPPHKCPNQFRTTNYRCEHCNTTRRRIAIFVLQNEAGEYRQVGRNCLADFLGHQNPDSMLAQAEHITKFVRMVGESESDGWGLKTQPCVSLERFVSVACVVARKLGYVSRKDAWGGDKTSTADWAWQLCTCSSEWIRKMVQEHNLRAEQKDMDTAKNAIQWAAAFGDDAPSTFLYDVGVCCRQPYVAYDRIGYLTAVIPVYARHLEQELRAKASTSEYVGSVGERLELELTIVTAKSYQSDRFGPKMLVKFTDSQGNIFIWRASSTRGEDGYNGTPGWIQIGRTVKCKATVFRHDEYLGIKETEVKRVKIEANQ